MPVTLDSIPKAATATPNAYFPIVFPLVTTPRKEPNPA